MPTCQTALGLAAALLLCGFADLPPDVAPKPAPPPAAANSHVLPVNQVLASLAEPVIVAPDHDYTLAELIDLAQSNNPDTRIAWATARMATGAVGISRSAYLPQISAAVFAAHTGAQSAVSGYGLEAGSKNAASGTLSALNLSWLLFDFGERGAVLDAAQQNAIAASASFSGTHQRLVAEVAVAYYRYVAAQIRAEASAGSVQNALVLEDAARERRQHGMGTFPETAQARQYSAQTQLAAVQGRSELHNAYQALLTSMGLSPLTKMHIAGLAVRPLPADLPVLSEQFINEAVARRPDVLAAYASEQSALAGVRASDAEFKPKVFATASGSYNANQLGLSAMPFMNSVSAPTLNVAGERGAWSVMVGISVPLYDGQLRSYQSGQAQSAADRASATLDKVRLEAIRQIVHAQNDIETGYAAHEAALELNEAARISFEAALEAYRQGQGTLTAATAAENALLAARIALGDSYSAALSSVVNLIFATGQLGAYSDMRQ